MSAAAVFLHLSTVLWGSRLHASLALGFVECLSHVSWAQILAAANQHRSAYLAPSTSSGIRRRRTPARPVASAPVTEVKLDVVDGDGYPAALDEQHGNVVLVDFWATWCEPCTKNFPHIVELHHKHQAAACG